MEERFIDAMLDTRTPSFLAILEAERCRGQAAFHDPDWIWAGLLEAAITLGRVPGTEVLAHSRQLLPWTSISAMNDDELAYVIERVYREGGVRFATRKTGWAVRNRGLILGYGGTEAFKDEWTQVGFGPAIEMLCRFQGIGPKYARNIGMIAVDPRFEDCAALDARILNLARHINPALPTQGSWYGETEDYLRGLAQRLGISLWQLDRTMFWRYEELSRRVDRPTGTRRSNGACRNGSATS